MTQRKHYPDKPEKIYYFGTCLVDLLYPEAGLAGMQLIQREGVKVIFPQDQTCCGQPAWNSGYRDEARAVAEAQLPCFPGSCPVVVPSGSCAGMIHRHYPELFKGTSLERQAVELAERTFELTEFLVHVLKIKLTDLGKPTRVVLHTSCSARREMGVADEHKALLQQLEHVELLEPARQEECCGFGGAFAVKYPELSGVMVEEKSDAILATGARQLVSGDCGCLMNITGHMKHRGDDCRGQHIASFLWERTHAAEG